MKITFWGETRTNFAVPSTENAVPSLGSFGVSEILLNEAWQKISETSVKFVASSEWVQNNLFPGRNPGNAATNFRRARYFTIRKPDDSLATFVLTNFEADELDDEQANVTVFGADPRIFFQTMSSSSAISGENWVTTRLEVAKRLTGRVSNASAYGMEAWQRLPILPLDENYTPTAKEASQGIRQASEIAPAGNITIGIPDPMPVRPAVDDLHASWLYAEIFPIDKFGADGTNSPFWRWGVRTKLFVDHIFSKQEGDLRIEKYSGNWTETEALAYDVSNPTSFSYATGKSSSRARLKGPWAGIKPVSFAPPPEADADAFLRSKANTETQKAERLTIQTTINFSKAGVNAYAGCYVNVRIGSKIYMAEAREIVSHYSAESGGWAVTSPVFISMDSIDLNDPLDPVNDIVFTIQSYSGTTGFDFILPSKSHTRSFYNWRVYVDGRSVGVFTGVSDPSSNSGNTSIRIFDGEVHEVVIQPADGNYAVGWGRAFSFANSSLTSRFSLRSIINDPDWAHLETPTDTGNFFRAYQFQGCSSLKTPVQEAMPTTVKNIGNDAFAYQYSGSGISFAPAEYIPETVESIGDNFRAYQYDQCNAIASGAIEMMSDAVESVGHGYRKYQYYKSRLTSAAPEALEKFKSVGNDFRRGRFAESRIVNGATESSLSLQFMGTYFRAEEYKQCGILETAAPEATVSCPQLGSNFRASRFSQCRILKNPATENLAAGTKPGTSFRANEYSLCPDLLATSAESLDCQMDVLPSGFRDNQYSSCASITTIASDEVLPEGLVEIGDYYRNNQFGTCSSLTTAQVVSDTPYANVKTIGGNFKNSQYSGCSSLISFPNEINFPELERIGSSFMNQTFLGTGPGIAPSEGQMPKLKTIGVYFRWSQYSNSKITEIGRESNMPLLLAQSSWRSRQYQNCVNVTNAKRYSEGLTPSVTVVTGREDQFYGSGIVYPLAEGDPDGAMTTGQANRGTGNNAGGYRAGQYQNCVNLIDVPEERDIIDATSSAIAGRFGNFRRDQFNGCVNLDVAGKSKISATPRQSTLNGYRARQFANTPLKNITGQRINYKDGTEVVEGQNDIPTDFYTDV